MGLNEEEKTQQKQIRTGNENIGERENQHEQHKIE